MRRGSAWLLLGLALAVALVIGAREERPPATVAARVDRISADVRCPTCEGLSVRDSNASSSEAIREAIEEQVRSGRTDAQVREHLVRRYGEEILLRPPARGIGAVVWALPVIALAVAATGLGLAFRRWRRTGEPGAVDAGLTDEDRARLARALGS